MYIETLDTVAVTSSGGMQRVVLDSFLVWPKLELGCLTARLRVETRERIAGAWANPQQASCEVTISVWNVDSSEHSTHELQLGNVCEELGYFPQGTPESYAVSPKAHTIGTDLLIISLNTISGRSMQSKANCCCVPEWSFQSTWLENSSTSMHRGVAGDLFSVVKVFFRPLVSVEI